MTILNEDNSLAYLMAGRKRDPFASRRAFAQKLAEQGTDTSPVQSPWQGVGRLAQALAGAYGNYTADAAEKEAGTALAAKIADAGKLTDPAAKLAAYAAIDPSIGLRYSAQSAAEEIKKKTQRDDDLQTANFMIGGPPGTQQAGGVGGGGRVASAPVEWEPHFQQASQQHGLPVPLIKAVAGTESNMDPNAVSSAGAGGVMQIMPGTAGDLGVTNRFDPGQSINKGTAYLKQQVDKYGNLPHALAAYNWGPGNVDNWLKSGGDPAKLPAETRNYIQKVQANVGGGGQQLAQGSADGSGNPLPPQNQGGDPGAQYFAAAQRAQAAGRGDIAIKLMQQATAAREAAATRDANRTLTPREIGPDLVWFDNRTGLEAGRVVGGAKKAPADGGAFAGTGMDAQARNALVRAAKDPTYAASPEYAAAHSFLSQPRQSFDESRGVMVTLPPTDLSAFPPPTFRGGQQAPPQGMPQQSAAAPPPGMPPAPSPQVVSGPTMQGAPPAAPQGGPIVTPVQGLPPKPMTEAQSKAYGFSQRMATANAQLDSLAIQGTSKSGRFGEALPGGIGNFIQTPEYQLFEQAKRNFMNAQLRDESGAVIGPSEFMSADKQYFPQPGQEMNKALHAQMAENRRQVVEAMMVKANILKPGERYNPPKAEAASPTSGNASPGAVDLKKKWNLE